MAGRVSNPDLAGKEFLSLLQRLRYVFLQDAALLQLLFPRLRLWRLALFQDPAWSPFTERVRAAEAVQEDPTHVAIRSVVPIVADAVSVVGNRLSVGQDRLLRATLTTPAVTADLVRQALQDQTTELTAALSAAAGPRRGPPGRRQGRRPRGGRPATNARPGTGSGSGGYGGGGSGGGPA